MIQNYINHIVFVIDRSGSMESLSNEVVTVFDQQIKYLATRSQEQAQETRVSVYLFDDTTDCLIYDMDVMRLPSLKSHYQTRGMTALIDGTLKAITDLKLTPEIYSDHAFLLYVLTDGAENRSKNSSTKLKETIAKLAENWTVAVMVPNQTGAHEAKKYGFPANNVQIWNTDKAGIEEVGRTLTIATDNFMRARATGVRSTKSLFKLDASSLDTKTVKTNLDELKVNEYLLLPVHKTSPIKEYVESWTKESYRVGSAYYQLSKPETIQNYKQICIQNKKNGKVYSGANARKLLALPNHEVKVNPVDFGDFTIFCQSSSINRKLIVGTQLLVMK